MNKARSEYLYQLIGKVKEQKKKLVNNRECIKLTVLVENKKNINSIQVFKDKLENEQIWTQITESQYIDKRYLFRCQNYFGNYHLISWKVLDNHGSN